MAITVKQYIDLETETRKNWVDQAEAVETDIDKALEAAIATNLVPNPRNPNFVLRFQFKTNVPPEVKQMMKIRYGQAGWTITENIDFRETDYHGYFDFYKAKP